VKLRKRKKNEKPLASSEPEAIFVGSVNAKSTDHALLSCSSNEITTFD